MRLPLRKRLPQAAVQIRYSLADFSPNLAFLRKISLSLHKSRLVLAEESWILDKLTIGEGGELFETNINADLFIGCWQRFCFDFTAEAGKPFFALTPNGAGFDL